MRLAGLSAVALVLALGATDAFAQKSKDTLRIGFYQPIRIVDTFHEPGPEPTVARFNALSSV